MRERHVFIYEQDGRRHYDDEQLRVLQERHQSVRITYFHDRDELFDRIADAEVIAGEITPAALRKAQRLRWFHTWAAGADTLLFPEMMASSVTLTCSRGNGAIPLAEHAIMLMLLLNRNGVRWIHAQDEHRWDRFVHGELSGLTCGIIGLGYSGIDLAEKAKAFHMQVLGLRRRPEPVPFVDELLRPDQLPELLRRSDIVVITAPLTPETRGMLGAAQFQLMKPTSLLICFSRGGIVDDDALLRALREGWIAGGGLDAHGVEPLPPDSPFWTAPNTIITPHVGSVTAQGFGRGVATFEENLERYLADRPLRDVVDKVAGY